LRCPAFPAKFGNPVRYRDTVQPGPAQRQKAQIVQSCNTLDDFLPGFGLPRNPPVRECETKDRKLLAPRLSRLLDGNPRTASIEP